LQRVVAEEMGEAFLRPPAADVSETVAAAGNERPVVVALGSDSEPGRSLERAAEERPVRVIYLGEGQEAAAEAAISDAAVDGSWLVLQNCHLAASHWPTTLERLAERALASGHAHFRLVLTFDGSGVTLGILQRGVKVAGERSGGLRSRVLHCFQDVVRLGSGSREDKTLLLATSLLHAVAQARGLSNGHSLTEEDFDLALLLSEVRHNTFCVCAYFSLFNRNIRHRTRANGEWKGWRRRCPKASTESGRVTRGRGRP